MGMIAALSEALAALPDNEARDKAAIELCRQYAEAIDANPKLLGDLGPKLQAALETLHMTPKARNAVKGGKSDDNASNPLRRIRDELAERRNGNNDATTVDPAAS